MKKIPTLLVIILALSILAHAEENTTLTSPNTTTNATTNTTTEAPFETTEPEPQNTTQPSQPPPQPIPKPPKEQKLTIDFSMSKIFPTTTNIGPTQLNIQITNTGDASIENLGAIITGEGIAVTDIVPIEKLEAGQQGYIIAFITANHGGNIPLLIRVLNKEFRSTLKVTDITASFNEVKKRQDAVKLKQKSDQLDKQLDNLTALYENYDHEYIEKKTQGYTFPELSFQDAKGYLRQSQANLAKADILNGEASLILVESELREIRTRLDAGLIQKKTWKDTLRENAPWIAAIMSTIVAAFAILDNLKKHGKAITTIPGKKYLKHRRSSTKEREHPK